MDYTPKEKATITHLSALLFTKEEIEILMNDNYGNTFEEMQTKGVLQGKYEIRKNLYADAKRGEKKAVAQWMILTNYLAL